VTFDEAFSRLGCSIATSPSAIVARPYNLPAAGALVRRHTAGVVELADTPGLGPGAARLGGSSPSARIDGCERAHVRSLLRPVNGERTRRMYGLFCAMSNVTASKTHVTRRR
jgi:hypothetical protein